MKTSSVVNSSGVFKIVGAGVDFGACRLFYLRSEESEFVRSVDADLLQIVIRFFINAVDVATLLTSCH